MVDLQQRLKELELKRDALLELSASLGPTPMSPPYEVDALDVPQQSVALCLFVLRILLNHLAVRSPVPRVLSGKITSRPRTVAAENRRSGWR